jgi:uncharacterized protein YybS (DUF2232 family)
MKRKALAAVILASLLSGIGVQANAAEKNVTHVVTSSPSTAALLSGGYLVACQNLAGRCK